MDKNGYPTKWELDKIRKWRFGAETKKEFYGEITKLMDFVKSMWKYADSGYFKNKGKTYWLSTGGWSGNESIMDALEFNTMFWMFCWQSSKRGGHYKFKLPAIKEQEVW